MYSEEEGEEGWEGPVFLFLKPNNPSIRKWKTQKYGEEYDVSFMTSHKQIFVSGSSKSVPAVENMWPPLCSILKNMMSCATYKKECQRWTRFGRLYESITTNSEM